MKRIASSLTSPPLVLAIVAILAYGLLLPQLGFYWDDLPMSWIRYHLGSEAMARYFSTNRPVWGLLYQVTTRLFPQVPIYWQVFALLWRWVTGLLVWAILRELFPEKTRLALGTALLFLVYPGFNQQWGAYLYSHFFIVISFLLFSYYLMLRAPRGRYWLKTGFGMLFSALNLWMHEYFFVLELMRPAVIWTSLREEGLDFRACLRRTLNLWVPYLAVFVAAVLSRLFIFNNQIYEISADQAGSAPFDLLTTIPTSLWTVTAAAWSQVFRLPDLAADGPRITLIYGVVTLVTYGVLIAASLGLQARDGERSDGKDAYWAMGLGLFILLVAGWPFWLTGVPVSLGYPANRATLSFMLGVSLLLAGLFSLLPRQLDWILLAVFVALAAGRQFQWSNDFRRDWNAQKNLFWQMTWRVPGLKSGTIVMMNEELAFYADNSIGAALNWIYAPDNHTNRVDYVLFYPTNRLGGALTDLEPGLPVQYDYLAGQFEGNTSQVMAFYYAPPGCLRLLDPEIDPYNRLIPDDSLLRDAAQVSTTRSVLAEPVARMPEIYGPEPPHSWCYHFERADLARQMGNWERVAVLGETAFKLDDYPNDPLERFVFIEGYAHVGEWKKALEYSRVSYQVSKNFIGPLLCKLWDRIDREVPVSPEKTEFVLKAKTLFGCNP
ncbi:MAG: hypothetical protein JW963_04040 [Anaerolineales bacterium]|nr:hypothetical protein [Anaerolineales bacterium]